MEGCEACLIDASEVVLFGWLGKCGVKTSPSYPIPFHSIPGYYTSMAFSHVLCSVVWKPYESPLLVYTVSQIDGLRAYGAPERESSPQYNGCCGWIG